MVAEGVVRLQNKVVAHFRFGSTCSSEHLGELHLYYCGPTVTDGYTACLISGHARHTDAPNLRRHGSSWELVPCQVKCPAIGYTTCSVKGEYSIFIHVLEGNFTKTHRLRNLVICKKEKICPCLYFPLF